MCMRLATTVLATALVFSQGSSFLVAALCPHLRSEAPSCKSHIAKTPMSHEDMGHMEMDHENAPNPEPDALAIDQPQGQCGHCAVHSRETTNSALFKEIEAARPSVDPSIALHTFRIDPVIVAPASALSSRAHGPPGESATRFLLINIFRI
jgi:uncharacterized protein involved in copper resistance